MHKAAVTSLGKIFTAILPLENRHKVHHRESDPHHEIESLGEIYS